MYFKERHRIVFFGCRSFRDEFFFTIIIGYNKYEDIIMDPYKRIMIGSGAVLKSTNRMAGRPLFTGPGED